METIILNKVNAEEPNAQLSMGLFSPLVKDIDVKKEEKKPVKVILWVGKTDCENL